MGFHGHGHQAHGHGHPGHPHGPGGPGSSATLQPLPLPGTIGADPPSTGASSVGRGEARSDRESSSARGSGTNTARILRKLRPAASIAGEKEKERERERERERANRAESTEEASSASVEMMARSSTGSVHSRASMVLQVRAAAGSPEPQQQQQQRAGSRGESRRKQKRKAWRSSKPAACAAERNPTIDAERSFQVLLQMARNPECLGYLLRGLLANIPALLRLLQALNDPPLHRSMAGLLHAVLKTALDTYGSASTATASTAATTTTTTTTASAAVNGIGQGQPTAQASSAAPEPSTASSAGPSPEQRELSAALCLLLRVCLSLIHGVHDLQYTAMVTINKVIDACVVHRLTHVKVRTSDALQHPCTQRLAKEDAAASAGDGHGTAASTAAAAGTDTATTTTTTTTAASVPRGTRLHKSGAKRLGSVWRTMAGEQLEQARRTVADQDAAREEAAQVVCVADVLSSAHALSVLNILHNALTLYKRVIGSKQQCSPSQREGSAVQQQLAQEPQLRILAAALDVTHDPQLLVLVLQIVATLALDPGHHRALLDHGLPDVLSQLLLPSDEWYYTNHSTKYARFVKHHAARTLVYLGLSHRVNTRFSVYDILTEDAPPPTPLTESLEDTYITQTSAPPNMVVEKETGKILGLSVEGAVLYMLKAFEVSLTQTAPTATATTSMANSTEMSTLQWVVSGATYHRAAPPGPVLRRADAKGDPCAPLFVQTLLACFPSVVSPVVLVRMLLHRLLTTAAPLQRWKSCASRSSFASASAHEAPRSPRSRASSTDTEPSSLRKRRKVRV
ncbi:hypothetical protein ONE63_008998 [Megalurothrips usitatus]|uniref:Uncharacterized protein n=1 Tax=Megalurothrips usitatus TaxID=439358 RepID=A0AAV7XQR7_9NEOP|nr:hypothetical protein ONE63_008998 [Megalurothrips usitatus]